VNLLAPARNKPTCNDEFIADLASCKAVISSRGQQLIGEARYFGKPPLVVRMPKQHEQEINARYTKKEGLGDYCSIA
jgi:UDP:flavonoid glycosyltransferase YjiC (YdhE family)